MNGWANTTGRGALQLVEVGWDVHGCDPSPHPPRYAVLAAGERFPAKKVRVSPATRLPS